jgi:PTH1 family peptidyl-tRNA hydrolase
MSRSCQGFYKSIKNGIVVQHLYLPMIAIVGLGNPGEKFEKTRHNAGFMAVDLFAKNNEFGDFELGKKLDAVVAKKGKILLAKPQTFMNESGKAVKKIAAGYKLKAKDFIIVHDDVDLPVGKIKISVNRGSAGHKGVESVIKAVGNKDLTRVRIGIQPAKGKPKKAQDMVIKDFSPDEEKVMKKTIKTIVEALECFIENGLAQTMNQFN